MTKLVIGHTGPVVDPETIFRAIDDITHIPDREYRYDDGRQLWHVVCRRLAVTAMRELTHMSYPEISRTLSTAKQHTQTLNSHRDFFSARNDGATRKAFSMGHMEILRAVCDRANVLMTEPRERRDEQQDRVDRRDLESNHRLHAC